MLKLRLMTPSCQGPIHSAALPSCHDVRVLFGTDINLNEDNREEIIDKLIEEFSSRFEDFAALEPVLRFFINPFNITEDDVLEIVSVYIELHNIEDLELEIINLQNGIILKAHSNDKMFWNLVDERDFEPPADPQIEALVLHLELKNEDSTPSIEGS
ncbi:uncharacterized protein TNCT_676621 [Trichonephila clavata]|uniref:Uncharacterized protein n=1 Tax=Trichonephila clavata TaxID=2740835 RepID=A0A8X6J7T9_TRICU|nr:uncharacterized protein TNCT_676621 [Trichonephila clavata]